MSQNILLASHGSIGALAAEEQVFDFISRGDHLVHLYVIPQWWADMTGDDWLNNGVSRNQFRNYLGDQLIGESQITSARIEQRCEKLGCRYEFMLRLGSSSQEFFQQANKHVYDQVIVGSRRPKSVEGLSDVMLNKSNLNKFSDNLCIVPHPYA